MNEDMSTLAAVLVFVYFIASILTMAWLAHKTNLRRRKFIDEIKARGHWRVDLTTGRGEWIPGTWPTPEPPDLLKRREG